MKDLAPRTTYVFAEFELDSIKRVLLKNGQPVALNPKAFEVLCALVQRRDEILSKDDLLSTVWPGQFVEENNLTVHVAALRKALGETRNEHRFIVTVPGKGYRFVASLDPLVNGEIVVERHKFERIVVDDGIEAPSKNDDLKPPLSRSNRVFGFALVALLIALGISGWFLIKRSPVPATPPTAIDSIAVMPFVNEGGNADTEYLSDGMTESLINSLSQFPKLTVKARSSVFRYKGKELDAIKIGNELMVQAVLLGRIVERGDNMTLSLELVDAKSNNQLWGARYNRPRSDLAVLQAEIANDISSKLNQRLANEATLKRPTENAEAYRLYLKGRYFWNRREPEEHKKAIALFEQAIALDPNYALAYAAIGDCYAIASSPVSAEVGMPKARAAAARALEIDPTLGEAYTVLAKTEWVAFNWKECERLFKRAVELNPNYPSLHQWYGEMLTRLGRFDEAIAEMKRAIELDPVSLIINSDAIYVYTMAHRYNEAIDQARKTIELDGSLTDGHYSLVEAYEAQGNYHDALAEYDKLAHMEDPKLIENRKREISELRKAFQDSGETGYWRKILEIEKQRVARGGEIDPYEFASYYSRSGNKVAAMDSLEKAIKERQGDYSLLNVNPAFDNLRSEARFQNLVGRINLEPRT